MADIEHPVHEAVTSDRDTGRRATWKNPAAPGAAQSPQRPGMTPDRSTVPGHAVDRIGRPQTKRRPLTQYGTAEEILRVYKQVPEEQIGPKNFEQASASFEEVRKAHPSQLPPARPKQPELPAGETTPALAPETSF